MSTLTRARTLHGGIQTELLAHLAESRDVILPVRLVEVESQEPASLVPVAD